MGWDGTGTGTDGGRWVIGWSDAIGASLGRDGAMGDEMGMLMLMLMLVSWDGGGDDDVG